jgi:isochorismate synthase
MRTCNKNHKSLDDAQMVYRETFSDKLIEGLRLASQQSARLGKQIVLSSSEPIPVFDPIAVIEGSKRLTDVRTFWAQPDHELTLLGLGVAHAVDTVESLRFRQAAADWRYLMAGAIVEGSRGLPGVGPLLLGGFAFDAQREGTRLWGHFPDAHLILPRLLLTKTSQGFWLTRNVVVDTETDIEFEALTLNEFAGDVLENCTKQILRPRLPNNSGILGMRALVSAEEWEGIVAEAIEVIQRDELEKVVLARAVELEAANPFDEVRALEHFSKHAEGTWHFMFATGQDVFLGATPEQLVRVRDGILETMGLAGSAPRGATPEEDERFGAELLASAKDRNEQEIVVRAMREVLGDTCVQLQANAMPTLLKLNSIQHIITRLGGTLAKGYSVLDLAERLHPTPAVGGRPRAAALEWLREHEKLDRGWYAGAVGWMDENFEGEFAVAIRSALLHENKATLFAGCGIVAGSDPEREFAESALKLKPMLEALGAGNQDWE